MKKLKNIIIIFYISTLSLAAQDLAYKKPFWLNLSIGGSQDYFNTNVSYNKVLENFSYQLSLNGIIEDILSQRGMSTFSGSYGYSEVRNWLIVFANAGPSVSYGEGMNKERENVYFWGTGVCLNAQVYFMPLHELFPGVGLGVELYYNYNIMQTKGVDYRHVYTLRIGACLTDLHMK